MKYVNEPAHSNMKNKEKAMSQSYLGLGWFMLGFMMVRQGQWPFWGAVTGGISAR